MMNAIKIQDAAAGARSGRVSFEAWMLAVDKLLRLLVGVTSEDLPDCCYRDWYDDGVSAKSAARRALRYAQAEERI